MAAVGNARASAHWFYVWMAVACTVLAFAGFAPTYLIPLASRAFVGPPVLHLHAALFFAWTLLFLTQTSLAATGRLEQHRGLGLFGIALATAMVFAGFMAATNTLEHWIGTDYEAAARAGSIIPISAVLSFAAIFAAAIATLRRPEWHKRLMLVATISLLPPAAARFLFVLFPPAGAGARPGLTPPPPVSLGLVPGLAVDTLILAGVVYDWRVRGRPHAAYLVGGAVVIGAQVLRIPLSATSAWSSFTDLLVGFTR
jgi:hypothetical protein